MTPNSPSEAEDDEDLIPGPPEPPADEEPSQPPGARGRGRPPGRPRSVAAAADSGDSEDGAMPAFLDPSRLREDLNGRPNSWWEGRGVVDIDKEITQRNQLYGAIAKYRHSDDAKVVVERLLPESWEGQPTKGFSDSWYCNTFQTADALLDQIKRTFGGYQYKVQFLAPNKAGDLKTMIACTVHINAPPIVQAPKSNGHTNNGYGQSPDAKLVEKVFDQQTKMIEAARGEKDDPRMLGAFTNIAREMRMAQKESSDALAKAHAENLSILMKQLDRDGKPEAGLIKFTSEQAASERDRLQSRFDSEKQQLLTMHQQDKAQSLSLHKQDMDNLRRDKDAEISRIQAQLDSLKLQQDMLKMTMENNFNTQVSNLKNTYENQLRDGKSSTDMYMTLNLNRISVLEAEVKALSSQRDQLMNEKISEAKNRPDSLAAVSGTLAAVQQIAGSLGLAKPSGGGEPDWVTGIKALKEIGIGDTVNKIADRFTRAPAPPPQPQQMPFQVMGNYQVPVDQWGRPLVPPPGSQAPQQPPPQAPPVQHTRRTAAPPPRVNESVEDNAVPPQVSPRQQPQQQQPLQQTQEAANPPPINLEEMKPVIMLFERALNENWPVVDMSKELLTSFPREVLDAVIAGGSDAFISEVERLLPESDLTSVRGVEWLKDLFHSTRKLLETTPHAPVQQ